MEKLKASLDYVEENEYLNQSEEKSSSKKYENKGEEIIKPIEFGKKNEIQSKKNFSLEKPKDSEKKAINPILFKESSINYEENNLKNTSLVYERNNLNGIAEEHNEIENSETCISNNLLQDKYSQIQKADNKPEDNLYIRSKTFENEMNNQHKHEFSYLVPRNLSYEFENNRGNGWIIKDNRFYYVTASYAVGSSDANYSGNEKCRLVYNPSITENQAFEHMMNMLEVAPKNYTVPLFSYSIMSLLQRLYRIARFEPRFTLWVYGASGSGKTLLSYLFCNIYNTDFNDDIDASTIDTVNSIDNYFAKYADIAIVKDDFFPSVCKKDINRMEETRNRIIRQVGERVAKSRAILLKDSQGLSAQNEYRPDVGVVCTAEDIFGGESDLGRVLAVKFESNQINFQFLSYYQQNKVNYSTAIYYFLKWVAENAYELINLILVKSNEYRRMYSGKFAHPRYHDSYICLRIAMEILYAYGYNKKLCNIGKLNTVFKSIQQCILDLVNMNSENIQEEKPGILFLIAIKELIDRGEEKILSVDYTGSTANKLLGFEDEQNYYLFPDAAYNAVIRYYRRESKIFPITKNKSIEELDRLGVISRSQEMRNGKSKNVRTIKQSFANIRNKRYLVINKTRLEQILYK